MTKFAGDCIVKLNQLMHILVEKLGEDTAERKFHFGWKQYYMYTTPFSQTTCVPNHMQSRCVLAFTVDRSLLECCAARRLDSSSLGTLSIRWVFFCCRYGVCMFGDLVCDNSSLPILTFARPFLLRRREWNPMASETGFTFPSPLRIYC